MATITSYPLRSTLDGTEEMVGVTGINTHKFTPEELKKFIADKYETLIIAASDETTPIGTGTNIVTFRMPYALTLTSVRASLTVASSSGTPTFDINENGVSILGTEITIDVSEKTSTTATIPPVISDADLADDAEITIDFDVAGTDTAGVKIYLTGVRV